MPVTAAEYWPVWLNRTLAGPETATVMGTTVTLTDPVALDSALTALMVTGLAGTEVGGVYRPAAEMVPVDAVPPVTPLAAQVTDWLVAPRAVALTAAAYCAV